MRSITRIVLLCLTAGMMSKGLKAQVDPHFSQYYVYPSWLNPALTGQFDGDYRVAGIYRNQWGNISTPFTTEGVTGEMNTDKNVSLGLDVLNQKAGNGGYNYTTAYGNFAYNGIRFGAGGYQRVVIGLQMGLIHRSFNPSKLTFGDQWNPVTGYNAGSTSSDVFTHTSQTSFDAGAGLMYFDAEPGKKANIYAGFAMSHITTPTDQFSATGNAKLPIRYTASAGVKLTINEDFSITPNALYLREGTSEEKMLGAYAQLKAMEGTDVMLGLNYRIDDAVAPYVGFTYKNMVWGLSYDINTSTLSQMAHGSNSFEISLSFTMKKTAKTPEMEFVCPRL